MYGSFGTGPPHKAGAVDDGGAAEVSVSLSGSNPGQTTPSYSQSQATRAREESMPDLGEFAAMWGFLLLTMFLPIRLKRRPIQQQDA